ncbi:MAG: arylsulfatase [Planctomycetes bacterium]|nr:arylsulfatase [Planctomycetota bacterium]
MLIILADDLGFSDLACYGSSIATPNLDALAAGGLRFTQCYNTARCWPTRGALMTGYYAQQIRRDALPGVATAGGKGTRPVWAPLVSTLLGAEGYRCYHSGKWHIDGEPLKNGFDHSFDTGAPGQSNFFRAAGNTDDGQPSPQTNDYYVTNVMTDHAVRCLKEHAEKYADRPFFHYLCYTAPHFPLHALPEDIARYRDKFRDGWNEEARRRHARLTERGIVHHSLPEMEREVGPPYDFPDAIKQLGPNEVNRPIPWSELSEAQRDFQSVKMAIHAAMIDRMDQNIGRVIAQLRAMNALDNTLILFLSDNGASAEMMVRGAGHDPAAPPGSATTFLSLGPGWSSVANTPLRRHKTWVHEGGINTPLIVHWPRGLKARGELRHNPAHVIDLVPTVLEVAGMKAPAEFAGAKVPVPPGRSLVPAFAKDGTVEHEYLWWLHEGNRALRVGDWKIVALKNQPWELYNLAVDRGESHNLASQYPDRVRELEAVWTRQADQARQLAQSDKPANPAVGKKKKPASAN